MKSPYMACMCAVTLASTMIPARGFELEKILVLDVEIVNAQVNTVQMIENLCPGVEEASICQLEFQLALKQFTIVARLLRMAAISHSGPQRQKIIARARRAFERGELLYQVALVENTPPVPDDLMDAAKLLSQQEK